MLRCRFGHCGVATLLFRSGRQCSKAEVLRGTAARVRVFKEDRFRTVNHGAKEFLGRYLNRLPTTLKYMTCLPFVDKELISFSTSWYLLSARRNNHHSFGTLVSVNEQEVIKTFEHFLSTTKDENLSTEELCSLYIEKLIRSGTLSDAAYLLSHLHDRQIHLGLNTYNILLNAAGEAKNLDLFCAIFKKLLWSRLPPDFTSYVNVAKVFQMVSDPSQLLKFIREVSDTTIHGDPIVMNRIIFLTARSGQIDKSLIIFEELKNLNAKINTVTFNTVLAILGKVGRVDQMLSEFILMKDLGHIPDIVTYNTLINCLRRLGRLDMCKTFAREMDERGIELDLITYTALIDGYGRAGHVEEAMKIFDEMKKSQRPSIYVYRAMISNLKKAGKFELALKLWEDMNSSTLKLIGPEDFRQKKKRKNWKVRTAGS